MYRSKAGTQSLNKVIKAMLADTALVKNLSNPEYVKIILNGHNTLEDRFAEIDEKLVRQEMKKSEVHRGISARMKKVRLSLMARAGINLRADQITSLNESHSAPYEGGVHPFGFFSFSLFRVFTVCKPPTVQM